MVHMDTVMNDVFPQATDLKMYGVLEDSYWLDWNWPSYYNQSLADQTKNAVAYHNSQVQIHPPR